MYRTAWNSAAILFSILGWAAALLSLSASPLVAFVVMAAVVGIAAAGTVPDYNRPNSQVPLSRYATWGLRAAVGSVAAIGMIEVAGSDGLILTTLVAASSPPIMRRIQDRSPARPVLQLPHSPEPMSPLPAPVIVWPSPDSLTDAELCRSWRLSYAVLEHTHSVADRIHLIEIRAAYLDALQHRDPESFARWLSSGARAAGDPARYLNNPASRKDIASDD
ncbi:hypothetical protein AB0P21_41355 [Kribbella sp. NPDC056861]|uniref:hypothetical protein n=1 Tax=Kribbella sp. NPDC056861 TaxID=3154857 RepID=UPI00343F26BF